jgi:hypothetical protein
MGFTCKGREEREERPEVAEVSRIMLASGETWPEDADLIRPCRLKRGRR